MALLHMDGFDMGDGALRYPNGSGSGTNTTTRFSYGRSIISSGSAQIAKDIVSGSTAVISGFAMNNQSGSISFFSDAGATQHITVVFGSTGNIDVRRGNTGGTILASATSAYSSGWNYFEVRCIISDTVGEVQVRVNGSASNTINLTSSDTKNGGTLTSIDRVSLYGNSQAQFDDWYIIDTTGSLNNTYLGDCRVYTLAPSGNGNYSQFVGSDGNSTDNYLLVDEQPYSTGDYTGSATSGNRDSYVMTDLPGTATTVFGVNEVSVVFKSDAGAATMKQLLRISATDYESSAVTLSTSPSVITTLRETNPNTSAAWTPAGVNGAEAGARVG